MLRGCLGVSILDDLLRLDDLLMLDDLSGFGQHVVFFIKKKIKGNWGEWAKNPPILKLVFS